MHREIAKYTIPLGQIDEMKNKMLNWSKQFSIVLYLDSNNYRTPYSKYECLLGAGVYKQLSFAHNDLDELNDFHDRHKDWLFGHINYDYKNSLESRLSTAKPHYISFNELSFFVPEVVCYIATGSSELVIETLNDNADVIYGALSASSPEVNTSLPEVEFRRRTTQQHYLDTVNMLREHIREGDCYEINYCNECYADDVSIDPLSAFLKLNRLSKAPFSAYYRFDDLYLLSASPERYLQKSGSKILIQPIKGTAARQVVKEEDEAARVALSNSVKDRAENVMITDLVRNDLARSCKKGSVEVEELFGIYSFSQVHQMISTVSAELGDDTPFTNVLKNSFPMGSMTGAPKIKVMELIDKYEDAARGLFSGTVGYITPGGDMDFNVIIRSLFYDAKNKKLSYQAGGAITYDSSAEAEWDEMRLKAKALEAIFSR